MHVLDQEAQSLGLPSVVLFIHDKVIMRNGLPTMQVCLHMLPSTSTQPDLSSQNIGLNDIVYLQEKKKSFNVEPE